jgi:hypothetical protein
MVGALGMGILFEVRSGIVGGILCGLSLGLALGLMRGGGYWLRYAIAIRIARRRNLLPGRPAKFLDWAYQAGLLRLSGSAIQFRHRELQDWLYARQADGKPSD